MGLVELYSTSVHPGGKLRCVNRCGSILADPIDAQNCREVIHSAVQGRPLS